MNNRSNDYTDSQLLHWYDLIMEFRSKHPIRDGCKRIPDMTKFCKRRGISAKKLQWLSFRFFYKEQYRPIEYKEDLETVRMYHESGLSKKEFCLQYNVKMSMLSAADMHLYYKARLEKQLSLRGALEYESVQPTKGVRHLLDALELQSIGVKKPPMQEKKSELATTHLIENPKNDITIKNDVVLQTKGITMSIDSAFGHEKLIKILEFLESL